MRGKSPASAQAMSSRAVAATAATAATVSASAVPLPSSETAIGVGGIVPASVGKVGTGAEEAIAPRTTSAENAAGRGLSRHLAASEVARGAAGVGSSSTAGATSSGDANAAPARDRGLATSVPKASTRGYATGAPTGVPGSAVATSPTRR